MAWLTGESEVEMAGVLGVARVACLSCCRVAESGSITAESEWNQPGREEGSRYHTDD